MSEQQPTPGAQMAPEPERVAAEAGRAPGPAATVSPARETDAEESSGPVTDPSPGPAAGPAPAGAGRVDAPPAMPTAAEAAEPPGAGEPSAETPVADTSVVGTPVQQPGAGADAATADPSSVAAEGGELEELVLPSLLSAPSLLETGSVLGPDGRLRVEEHLGTAGQVNRYAATWRQDDGQGIPVELREAPADHVGLKREAEILTAVRYAMLSRAQQTWEDGDRRYLILDRLDGETLEQALKIGVPVERALSTVLQLTQVVRRLHQAGWAPLGLTPADVVLGQPLRIARLWQAGRIGDVPVQALSVPGYSAPELAYRETVTGKEDVYTLGAILYYALAGQPPSERGVDAADLTDGIRLPGAPQLLADVLVPAEDRVDLDELYRRLLALKARHAAVAVSLEVASATSLGLNPTRLANEDSSCYAVWAQTGEDGVHETALLCVADGMGGMEAGEVASQTAVGVVMRGAVEMVWPSAGRAAPATEDGAAEAPDKTPGQPRIDPAALVRRAATAVHAAGQGRDLGTTITCVAVHDGELILAHVGDTRAYLLRGGKLTRLTADHSLVAAMVASGVISPEEAEGHPDSNKVLRSLGSQRELPERYVDGLEAAYGVASLRLDPGDLLMLCSDGVWGSVPDREIKVILTEALDAQNAARALVDRAIQAGAPDNATAVVAQCVRRPVL